MMNRITFICLGVRDMRRSLAFYKAMGFATEETDGQPPVVFFDNAGSKLELYPLQGLSEDINASDSPAFCNGGFHGITLACNFDSAAEVDACMQLAAKNGAVIVKQPQSVFWGGYSGYFTDPDGYYWEVAYAPKA